MKGFDWLEPRTVAEAAAAASTTAADAMTDASDDGSILKAGGIDLIDLMKQNLIAPRRIVNLRRVPDLDTIVEDHEGGLRIGALVTLAAISRYSSLRPRYAALADAVESSGSPQLRNVATLGGNILQRPRCWYFRSADFPCRRKGGAHCYALFGENQYHAVFGNEICAIVHPSTAATALVALDAAVELTNGQGQKRRVALENFLVRPEQDVTRESDLRAGEVLAAVCLPPMPETTHSVHLRQGEKDSVDWPLAEVAVSLDVASDGICRKAAIVLGAAAPVPHRARLAEAALVGHAIDGDTAVAAARAALSGANPLAKNSYKLPIIAALVRRAVLRVVGEA